MKLYLSAGSPFARKIRVMLLEKNAPHEVETVDLWAANDLKQSNPVGKVPALKLDDGRVLANSPLIADYVDGRYPEPRFIPADPEGRLDVRCWEAMADATMGAAVASLYEARFHDEAKRSREWLERQRGKLDSGFAALERMLGNRP
jgi:glutathione S-transferase